MTCHTLLISSSPRRTRTEVERGQRRDTAAIENDLVRGRSPLAPQLASTRHKSALQALTCAQARHPTHLHRQPPVRLLQANACRSVVRFRSAHCTVLGPLDVEGTGMPYLFGLAASVPAVSAHLCPRVPDFAYPASAVMTDTAHPVAPVVPAEDRRLGLSLMPERFPFSIVKWSPFRLSSGSLFDRQNHSLTRVAQR